MKLTTSPGNGRIHGLRWLLAAAAALALATQACAQLTTVGPGAFSASATTLTFENLAGSDSAPLPTYQGVTLNGGTIVQLYSDYSPALVTAAALAGLGSVATTWGCTATCGTGFTLPGAANLVVDGGQNSRVFFHGGTGTLSLDNMTIANGHIGGDRALGGCIYSKNSVGLVNTVVTGCTAQGVHYGGGGGVLAFNNLAMTNSAVENNLAEASAGTAATGSAIGGGVAVVGKLTLFTSQISGNHAHADGGFSFGGGAYVIAGVEAKYSTFDSNLADVAGFDAMNSFASGGALALGRNAPPTTFDMRNSTISHNRADVAAGMFLSGQETDKSTIYNSTISMNAANYEGGGLVVGTLSKIYNSTIAFNTAGSYGGGGLIAESDTLRLESTIIADNSPSGNTFAADLDGSAVLSGHNNLVKIIGSGITLPTGTLRSDPHLGPLQDNGGPTRTQALMSDSPAIDAGNNTAKFPYDQRLTGFNRVVGVAADIGAVEYDPDIIFVNGFN